VGKREEVIGGERMGNEWWRLEIRGGYLGAESYWMDRMTLTWHGWSLVYWLSGCKPLIN
jgi:hypothetical protein